MPEIIQAIRGMNDILPPATHLWQHIERILRKVLQSYGYQEIRFPIAEKTELFKRTIGEATDIVNKEMYTFLDRNGDSLTLRPEGTACCVRACLEHSLLHGRGTQRYWYTGPYFRYERPQKGRYRQFHQYGAEIFGLAGPDIDAELILTSAHILQKIGLSPYVTLQLNTLGSPRSRIEYRKALVAYLIKHKNQLDEDSLRRLDTNPLRILDSKNPELAHLIKHAPSIMNYLDHESVTHFEKLQEYLGVMDIKYKLNPQLVRGLDYYTNTVFEWVTQELGAQGTVCAGGRYDGLVEQLGGKPTPALGFAIGLERLILMIRQLNNTVKEPTLHIYFVTDGDTAFKSALKISDYLRKKVSGLKLLLHCGGGSLKNQFKKADKSGAQFALILGEHELKTHTIALKPLREEIPQQSLHQEELAEYFKLKIAGEKKKTAISS